MKIQILGGNLINLSKNDFIMQGGEGSIYTKGSVVYKIYNDLKKMIPEGKIKELQILTKPNIIKPRDIILDEFGKKIIGFTMDKVENSESLCKLFTNSFRDRNGITEKSTADLVNNLKEGIEFIHSKKCLIVDLNEMNFLVDSNSFKDPYFIDVNSYQTPSYPATAIMPNIKDHHTKGFTELSDWFSFAIISFQLFIGIHPYKGSHPKYKKTEMIERMKDNISVFNKDVTLPKICRDFSVIPTEYLKWYENIFLKNKRLPPPDVAGLINSILVTIKIIDKTDAFEITMEKEYPSKLLTVEHFSTKRVALTKDKMYINRMDYSYEAGNNIIFSRVSLKPVRVSIKDKKIELFDLEKNQIIFNHLSAERKMIFDNQVYIKQNDKLVKLKLDEISGKLVVSVAATWNIMPNSTELFKGMFVEYFLDHVFIGLPNSKRSEQECNILDMAELKGYRIINAKYENKVVMLIGRKDHKYDKFIIRFDSNYKDYDLRKIEDTDNYLNFTVLDNGLCVTILEDGILETFVNTPTNLFVKRINDKYITSDMSLISDGSKVMFFKDNKIYSMKMKSGI